MEVLNRQALKSYLTGGDLRSIADVDQLIPLIQNQNTFDLLFQCLFTENRLIKMRAVDAIEKITLENPSYLDKHKGKVLDFLKTAENKEFKWHLALLVSRIDLNPAELEGVWEILIQWAKDRSESKIVRVNSIQSLFRLSKKYKQFERDVAILIDNVRKENIPSVNARIKKLF